MLVRRISKGAGNLVIATNRLRDVDVDELRLSWHGRRFDEPDLELAFHGPVLEAGVRRELAMLLSKTPAALPIDEISVVSAIRAPQRTPGGDDVSDELLRHGDMATTGDRRVRPVDFGEVVAADLRDLRAPLRAAALRGHQSTVAKSAGRDLVELVLHLPVRAALADPAQDRGLLLSQSLRLSHPESIALIHDG